MTGLCWRRHRAGVYSSGKYLVERCWGVQWYASGPGIDQVYDLKAQAQAACAAAHRVVTS